MKDTLSALLGTALLSFGAISTNAWVVSSPPPRISPSSQSRTTNIIHHSNTCNPAAAHHVLYASASDGDGDGDDDMSSMGLNELQTLLRRAVSTEDYLLAKRYRDELADRVSTGAYRPAGTSDSRDVDRRKMKRLSWRGLGTARWLEDRLDALNYKFPTTIQINAFEAVNTMLGALDNEEAMMSGEDAPNTLEELIQRNANVGNMGVVVSGSTGSGKTLAYLVPMLSTLSDSLFTRQRIRVKAEEDIGDVADDLLARVAVQTSPTIRGQGRKQVGGGGGNTIATGAAMSTLGKSGTDVKSPLALIVVPTRELGIQTALLLYECVGGSTKKTQTEMPGLSNMFKYKGPKGVKIGCVLDDEEAKFGLKLQTDVAITTPKYLGKLMRDGDIIPENLRVVMYDEADLALEQTPEDDLRALFSDAEDERTFSRLTYVVGATVTESLGKLIVRDGILPQGKSFIATASQFAPLSTSDADAASGNTASETRTASLKDLGLCLDPGLRHERVVAPDNRGMLCLVRMLRKELQEYDETVRKGDAARTQIQRPRVVAFFPGEEEAKAAIEPMRDALWGEHRLCVLLPNIGVNPLEMMEQFKSNATSVMLATPNSVRGLDFANLTHVYTMYLPSDDPREYLHLAGRVGRIGQMGSVSGVGGRVTSILKPEEAEQMDDLAKELGFTFNDFNYDDVASMGGMDKGPDAAENDGSQGGDDNGGEVERMRRYLEDTITLLDLAEEPEVDLDAVAARASAVSDDDDGDDNDDEDEEDEEI
mmetsp:Transcript_12563/g.29761  ORF Transcript_12563/g.29761 Transcript_12563/m.29761 type:complete len:764 (+) Transcript_12563:90-2381(+)